MTRRPGCSPRSGAEGRGDLAWLSFEGRWGEFQPSPYDAPPGPAAKGEWDAPMEWQDSLRDSSFAIPASATVGPTATDAFCSVVRAGGRIYTAVTSPFVLLLLVAGLVSVGGIAARSTKWSPPLPLPLRRRRESGQILRDSARFHRAHRPVMLALGALFIPAAIAETVIYQLVLDLAPLRSLIDTAGEDSLVSAAVALIVGGAGHVIAAAVVLAGAAGVAGMLDSGRRVGVREAFRRVGERLGAVLGVLGLATVAVILLVLTIVGIPVAVYLIGRWAVANQVAVLEGLPAREALRRSAGLTRGRWWRTVRLAAVVNILGAISGPAIGIALLFTTDLPLVAINAVSSLVFIVAMPFVGLAMAFLYGDLVAAETEDGSRLAREPLVPDQADHAGDHGDQEELAGDRLGRRERPGQVVDRGDVAEADRGEGDEAEVEEVETLRVLARAGERAGVHGEDAEVRVGEEEPDQQVEGEHGPHRRERHDPRPQEGARDHHREPRHDAGQEQVGDRGQGVRIGRVRGDREAGDGDEGDQAGTARRRREPGRARHGQPQQKAEGRAHDHRPPVGQKRAHDQARHEQDEHDVVAARAAAPGRRRVERGRHPPAGGGDSRRIWRRSTSTPAATRAASTSVPSRRRSPDVGAKASTIRKSSATAP